MPVAESNQIQRSEGREHRAVDVLDDRASDFGGVLFEDGMDDAQMLGVVGLACILAEHGCVHRQAILVPHQIREDGGEQLVLRGINEENVEFDVERIEFLVRHIARVAKQMLVFKELLFGVERGKGHGDIRLDDFARLIQVVDELLGDGRDSHAAPGENLDKPLFLELEQRFADGGTAKGQLLEEHLLGNLLPRHVLAVVDGSLEMVVNLLGLGQGFRLCILHILLLNAEADIFIRRVRRISFIALRNQIYQKR